MRRTGRGPAAFRRDALSPAAAEALSVALLLVVLGFAVARPEGAPKPSPPYGTPPHLGSFTRLGLLTVPAGLLCATVALWAMLRATGGRPPPDPRTGGERGDGK